MDHSVFQQAIVEDPADDVARLAYADWLEEQGDPDSRDRADLIRVQYGLEDLDPDDPLRMQFEQRQRDLLLTHGQTWAAPVRELGVHGYRFRRGFVERIVASLTFLVAHGEELCQLTPVRELATLAQFDWSRREEENFQALAGHALLPHIEAFDLSEGYSRHNTHVPLLTSRLLRKVTRLRMPAAEQTWTALEESHFRDRLRELELIQLPLALASTTLSLEGVERLTLEGRLSNVRSGIAWLNRSFPNLRRIQLTKTFEECPPELFRWADESNIEELHLVAMPLFSGAGRRRTDLARRNLPPLPRLRRLALNTCRITAREACTLAAAPFVGLTALNLRTNRLGDDGVSELAFRGSLLSSLSSLSLSYNRITAIGVGCLATAWPENLAVLDLSWNPIGVTGVRAVAEAATPSLTALDLSYCGLSDEAAFHLAGADGLAGLHTLNLDTNRIGDRGVAALAQSPHLRELKALNLGNNPVGDAGARALMESPLWQSLTALNLLGTQVRPSVREELRRAFRGILG